jgi:hypothetical protein
MKYDLRTVIPAIVSLIVFAATLLGHNLDQLNVEQGVTAAVTLVGIVVGIFTEHKILNAPVPVTIQPQPTVIQVEQPQVPTEL